MTMKKLAISAICVLCAGWSAYTYSLYIDCKDAHIEIIDMQQKYRELLNEKSKWLKIAAEQGNAEAQFFYGFRCKDASESAKWIIKSAEQGYEPAESYIRQFTRKTESAKH